MNVKGTAVQIVASGVALALMAGSAGMHWWKVKGMASRGADPQWVSLAVERPESSGPMLVSTGPPLRDAESGSGQSKVEMNAIVTTMGEMVSVLKDLRTENDDLRDQVREIHRDLNEAQLRLDSHSESFRPLKISEGIERLVTSEHPLLPPKRR